WFSVLAALLDRRCAARFARLLLGAILAWGRRTVTSWIRAAGLSAEFRSCYTTVAAAGERADILAGVLARLALRPLLGGADRLTPRAVGGGGRRAPPAPGPHATAGLGAARRGGGRPPHPPAGPGGRPPRLRPRRGGAGAARGPPVVGRDRPAAAGPPLRP